LLATRCRRRGPAGVDEGVSVLPGQSMHEMTRFIVLAFSSTRDSLSAEHALIEAGVGVKVMPLPRHRGRLCGIALRLRPADERAATQVLGREGITISARDEIEDW
jgi:hypothetical protein